MTTAESHLEQEDSAPPKEYWEHPCPDIPLQITRGLFQARPDNTVTLAEAIPSEIIELLPYIEDLQRIGRAGAYPDAFRLDDDGRPIDNVLDHTRRCVEYDLVLRNFIFTHLTTEYMDEELRNYLLLLVMPEIHLLPSFHWIHDLGESYEQELVEIDLVDYFRDISRTVRVERNSPQAIIWDKVQAAVRREGQDKSRFERHRAEKILGRTPAGEYLYRTYYETFEKAGHWLKSREHPARFPEEKHMRAAVLAKIVDLCDGNVFFHERFAEYLRNGGRSEDIIETAQTYTFRRTEEIIGKLTTAGPTVIHPAEYMRRIMIAVLFEHVRLVEQIWRATGDPPPLVAEGLQRNMNMFWTITEGGVWRAGNIK